MDEIWKDIADYEGYYQISNLGRVRSVDRYIYNVSNFGDNKISFYKGKILRPSKRRKGYLGISLTKKNKQRSFLIHRLVAQAFIPNSNNLPQVNHIDEDKTNNQVCNLEWCDNKYNINYGNCIANMSKTRTNNMHNQKPVICIETGIIYANSNDAQRKTNVYARNIRKNCDGVYKSAGKLHWGWVSKKQYEKFMEELKGKENEDSDKETM